MKKEKQPELPEIFVDRGERSHLKDLIGCHHMTVTGALEGRIITPLGMRIRKLALERGGFMPPAPESNQVVVVFQVMDPGVESWEQARIVYALKSERNFDITPLCDAISAVLGNKTVRTARLELSEVVNVFNACQHSGGYYQSNHSLTY